MFLQRCTYNLHLDYLGNKGLIMRTLLKLILQSFIFITLFTLIHADNNKINGTCPGEVIQEISGTTTNVSHTENGGIGGGGNDRYRMTFLEAGTLDISVSNTNNKKNADYRFYISRNNCGNNDNDWNIENSYNGKSPSFTVNINSGDVIYIRLQSDKSLPNKGNVAYALALNFTANTLGNTCNNAINVGLNQDINTQLKYPGVWNGQPLRYTYYSFTPPSDGTVRIHSTSSPQNIYLELDDTNCQYIDYADGNPFDLDNVSVTAGTTYKLYIDTNGNTPIDYIYRIDYTPTVVTQTPPTITGIPNPSIQIGDALSIPLADYTTEPNGDVITYSVTGLPNGMYLNTSTGLISGTPTAIGTFNVTATATDGDGSDSDNFTITVTGIPISAQDDGLFTTPPNTDLFESVLGNDSGYNITMTAITIAPTNGTVTFQAGGFFQYSPDVNYTGADSFTYQITDHLNNTATAQVTINVALVTDYQSGVQDFELINPINTRNIIGNYIIAGNTIECITDDDGRHDAPSTNPNDFQGTCQDSGSYNDNNFMSKYLDIDGDSKTWNSSSSNFTLPTTQSGILWAGIFWQGSLINYVSNVKGKTNQRRGYLDASGNVKYKYITSNQTIDLTSVGANKLLLKLDGETTYSNIQSSTYYYDNKYTYKGGAVAGGYYAAYADITYELQKRNLSNGNHTITIANLTSNEGRQIATGDIGGWSVVIIYNESGGGAKARNISVYNGYTIIPKKQTVKIDGFKLPSTGTVNSTFSAFAGEGEKKYKPDSMVISRFSDLSSPQQMPGADDINNIFDAQLANIQRDSANDNDVVNANGIDIEDYNVSKIMTTYRDADANLSTVYVGLTSSGDYITPSMMAFATELYRPNICVDYTIQKDNYDITQDGRFIDTRGTGKLSVTLALQSLEGDFDFINTQIGVRMVPTSGTSFDNAYYTPNSVNTFIQAFFTGSSTSAAPMIAIGENAGVNGGTVRRNQRYFARFDYDLNDLSYTGKFEVDLNTTINFGSGEIPSFQSTQYNDVPPCEQNLTYAPLPASFNIERPDSGNYASGEADPTHRYPLYTQVVGKDFNFRLVAYDQSATPPYSSELSLTDYTVDIELIDAAPFNDAQSIFTCTNPDTGIIQELDSAGTTNIFAHFPDSSAGGVASSDVNLSSLDIQTKKALKNAAFRMWYIVDKNNTILPHKCTGPNDNGCFETVYKDRLESSDTTVQADTTVGFCHSACDAGSGYNYTNTAGKSGCYACLHDFFSRSICSRDNFAIRPASYRVQISDNSQATSLSASETAVGENDSAFTVPTPFTPTTTLAAGYAYKLTGIATSYINDTTVARGYYRGFTQNTSPTIQSALIFDTDTSKNPTACVDKNSTYWNIDFYDGQIRYINPISKVQESNLVTQGDVGYYNYQIADVNWTLVDQDAYQYKTFDDVDDCLPSESSVAVTGDDKSGCVTDTTLTVNGEEYIDLQLLYRPYRFDIANVNYTKHPSTGGTLSNGDEYTYLNDLNSSYYSPTAPLIDMAVSFEGNITALALGAPITQPLLNFTNLCMANDLSLELSRTTNPDERTALVNKVGDLILFQQYLQHSSILNPYVDQQEGIDKNVTFPKVGFPENASASGIAAMYLHTTFKKPLNSPVNPFRVTYEDINLTGGLALTSFAHQGTHTPVGGKTYDQNLTYFFAKVTPLEFIYQNVLKSFKKTPISVDIFCDLNVTLCNGFDLNISSLNTDETADWYSASNIFNSLNDGTTDLVASTIDGASASPGVSPSNDISFTDANASKVDINVTVTGSGRPSTVGIEIRPVPWLRYDKDGLNANGYPSYQVDFIDGAGWSGIGNTGEVVETKSSNQNTQRMNW